MRNVVALNKSDVLRELATARGLRGGFGTKGAWIGLNYAGIGSDGTRVANTQLLRVVDEAEWRVMLSTLPALHLRCSMLKLPGTDDYLSLLRIQGQPERSTQAAVVYYGIEVVDNEAGEGTGDPRASALPSVLSGTTFSWPYVYIWANITDVDATTQTHKPETQAAAAAAAPPSLQGCAKVPTDSHAGSGALKRGFLIRKAPECHPTDEYATPNWVAVDDLVEQPAVEATDPAACSDILHQARELVRNNKHDRVEGSEWDDESAAVALAAFCAHNGVPIQNAIREATMQYEATRLGED